MCETERERGKERDRSRKTMWLTGMQGDCRNAKTVEGRQDGKGGRGNPLA